MNGKDKCRILKEIRRQIAQENDIEWVVSECSHKGNCTGTCPKCESEVRQLERELSIRRKLGKAVAISGISAACVAGLTGCTLQDAVDVGQNIIEKVKDLIPHKGVDPIGYELDGDVSYQPFEDELDGYVAPDDSYEYFIPEEPAIDEIYGAIRPRFGD